MIQSRTVASPIRRDAIATFTRDEPTMELLIRAQRGERLAVELLLERCLPALKRWAHGRLPPAARGGLETADLVQESVLHVIRRLDTFEPRNGGAMQAYLREAVINLIRDAARRVGRRPHTVELPEDHACDQTSPLEAAIKAEACQRFRNALTQLRPRDRDIVRGRVECHWDLAEIARRFRLPTAEAARMALRRALLRLSAQLNIDETHGGLGTPRGGVKARRERAEAGGGSASPQRS